MSETKAQMAIVTRNPKAMMEYQLYGRLPQVVEPKSPLITYLEKMPAIQRMHTGPVTLLPKLGYQTKLTFNNAQLLLQYLKPQQWMHGSWPAESHRIKRFQHAITDALFAEALTKNR